jgi:hypothetical protein
MTTKHKILKIILITKNEKSLIKPWIKYHGNIFGYDNLHIIDDSDDADILNYYDSLNNLGIHFYQENNNLNTVEYRFNEIMKSLKDKCDFIIKLDTDEFIGAYNQAEDTISVDQSDIYDILDSLDTSNGLKYKSSYTIISIPNNLQDNIINCTTFKKPCYTEYKTFFNSKTFLYCDLGSHNGQVIGPYSSEEFNKTNLAIIHYHFCDYETYLHNCKKAIISHQFIEENDSIEKQIDKLQSGKILISTHKAAFYFQYLTNPNHKQEYYSIGSNQFDFYNFDKIKKLIETL